MGSWCPDESAIKKAPKELNLFLFIYTNINPETHLYFKQSSMLSSNNIYFLLSCPHKIKNRKSEVRVNSNTIAQIAAKIKIESKNEADTNYYKNTTTSMHKPLSSL